MHVILKNVNHTWGRPARESDPGWVVIDTETSGFQPGTARMISLAVLTIDSQGQIEQSVVSLLNPGVDPGPTHIHGVTAQMLAHQPTFADIADDVLAVLHGRTLVAHNVAFDYSFLAAEAELIGAVLPTDTVMCTVELARRLHLGLDNVRLETLAQHWGITQHHAHDAYDDAVVLSRVLTQALQHARDLDIWLPVRPVTRRRWPNGRVTHDELAPMKMMAAQLLCPYANPGHYVPGKPLMQGMRVALSTDVTRTHEELVERIVHAGLAYVDTVDAHTSLVVCNAAAPGHGKGYAASTHGVPLICDDDFIAATNSVAPGIGVDEFTASGHQGRQFVLF